MTEKAKRPRSTGSLMSARRAYLQALAEHRAWRLAVEQVRAPAATSNLAEALAAASADARLALDRATFKLIDATLAAGKNNGKKGT